MVQNLSQRINDLSEEQRELLELLMEQEGLDKPGLKESLAVPLTPTEKTLIDIWAEVLDLEQVGIHDNFFELGGDSLLALRVISQAKQAGLCFTQQQFFQHQTIAELAKFVNKTISLEIEQGSIIGEIPLTSTQEWFLQEVTDYNGGAWSTMVAFAVPSTLLPNPAVMEQVIHHIWRYHDQLRARFIQDQTQWRQFIANPDETLAPFYYIDLSELNPTDYETAIKTISDNLQIRLDLAVGPLFRVALFYLGQHLPLRLVVIIHHLVTDGVSNFILIEDLATAYSQTLQGEPIRLLPKTTSIEQWIKALRNYAQSSEMRQEMNDYWFKLPWKQLLPLPVDYPENKNRRVIGLSDTVPISLSVEETNVLQKELPKRYNAGVLEALIMATFQAITQWTGCSYQLINILSAGRDVLPDSSKADISRTVGWTHFIRLLLLERAKSDQPKEILLNLLEQLHRIPNKGLGFDLLNRYGNEEIRGKMKRLCPYGNESVQILYQGDVDRGTNDISFFQPVSEPSPIPPDPQGRDYRNLLILRGQIKDNRFMAHWEYNRAIFKQATVEKIAADFLKTLQLLIAEVSS